MKKRLFLALCLVVAVMLTAIPAMAAGSVDAWIEANKTTISPGDSITITVYAEVDSCGSGGSQLSFDSTVFSLDSGESKVANAFMNGFLSSTKSTAFAFNEPSPVSGIVSQFTLTVKDDAPSGSHTITITFNADGTSDSSSVTISMNCDHTYDNGCDETCNKCGATREADHSYDGGKITTPATCGKEGVKTYTCTTCGAAKTEAVAKADHTWDSGKVTKEATCTQEGEMVYTCTACGATKTEQTDTLEHNYTVIGYVPATCEENGAMEFLCADCGYSYDDYIEAKGHSYDFDCDEECNTCGAVRETEHDFGESWFSDKSSHYQQCNICGLAQEPAPHVPGAEATETEDQVCLICGFVLEPAGRHTHKAAGNFLSNEDKHWYLCQCGALMGENAHHWEDKGIENGVQTYKCVICSRVETKPVETTAPTEATTLPPETTQAPTVTTAPAAKPADNTGIPGLVIIISLAILGLAIVGAVAYVTIGLILGYRKKGKFDAKRKTAAVGAAPAPEEAPEEATATEE